MTAYSFLINQSFLARTQVQDRGINTTKLLFYKRMSFDVHGVINCGFRHEHVMMIQYFLAEFFKKHKINFKNRGVAITAIFGKYICVFGK